MSSCELHGTDTKVATQMFQFNTNPAPSKLFNKVMNLMLKKGKFKMGSSVSFGQFVRLCTKQHAPFYTILSYFFDQLATV